MPSSTSPLRVGCASGFSGDRTDGAAPIVAELIRLGGGTLIFETLAERTLALAQLTRKDEPSGGYEPLLDDLVGPILADCLAHRIAIVSNFGAANPAGAARRIVELAQAQGLRIPRIAVITGDALTTPEQMAHVQAALDVDLSCAEVVSATVYLGATEIAQALRAGADIVVAGRVADPSLTVGPALAHFNWSLDDWVRLGRATMAGHMLECGTQVTGGYYAIPGLKDVPGLHNTGFPILTMDADGQFEISKPPDTGGLIDTAIATEQLLYEVHDPAAYLTPDVVADISQAEIVQVGPDRVAVRNVTGHARPDTLKVNICLRGGWLAEAEISYAGFQAEARARLAGDIVRERIGQAMALRIDLIGALSILADDAGALQASRKETSRQPSDAAATLQDVRLRVCGSHANRKVAERVLREVTALYCCGPAGGGGVRTSLKQRLNMLSAYVARDVVNSGWYFLEDTP